MKVAIMLYADMSNDGSGEMAVIQDKIASFLVSALDAIPTQKYWACDDGFRSRTFMVDCPPSKIKEIVWTMKHLYPALFDEKNIAKNHGGAQYVSLYFLPGRMEQMLASEIGEQAKVLNPASANVGSAIYNFHYGTFDIWSII